MNNVAIINSEGKKVVVNALGSIYVDDAICEYLFNAYEDIAKHLIKAYKADRAAALIENGLKYYESAAQAAQEKQKAEYEAARNLLAARNMAKNAGIKDFVHGFINMDSVDSRRDASAAIGSAMEMVIRRESEKVAFSDDTIRRAM